MEDKGAEPYERLNELGEVHRQARPSYRHCVMIDGSYRLVTVEIELYELRRVCSISMRSH